MSLIVGGRGRSHSVHTIRLVNIRQSHNSTVATLPPERVANYDLPEGRDEHEYSISHGFLSDCTTSPSTSIAPHVAPIAPPPIPPTTPAIPFHLNINPSAFVAQLVTIVVIVKSKDPQVVVDLSRIFRAYDSKGSFNANIANK